MYKGVLTERGTARDNFLTSFSDSADKVNDDGIFIIPLKRKTSWVESPQTAKIFTLNAL